MEKMKEQFSGVLTAEGVARSASTLAAGAASSKPVRLAADAAGLVSITCERGESVRSAMRRAGYADCRLGPVHHARAREDEILVGYVRASRDALRLPFFRRRG